MRRTRPHACQCLTHRTRLVAILKSVSHPRSLATLRLTCKQQSLPSLNQGFEQQHPRASLDTYSLHDSRRSSVDSRMNVGMGTLHITPSSPYESQNASRVSLVSNLQQQRGISTDQRSSGGIPLSPVSQRNGQRPTISAPRRAPVITPNPRAVSGMPDPMAAAPTKGFPWAFPDSAPSEERRGSSSGESSMERSEMSRQNSYAASVNSSIYTADSNMPSGQKRFDDGMFIHALLESEFN